MEKVKRWKSKGMDKDREAKGNGRKCNAIKDNKNNTANETE